MLVFLVIVLLTIILLRPSVKNADLFHEIQEALNSTIRFRSHFHFHFFKNLANPFLTTVVPIPILNFRDTEEVGNTNENVGCEGEYYNIQHLRSLPTGWKLLQRRGQHGNPEDFFSSKLWNDYEQGFGEPEKGRILVSF